jgi:hypothetical protein
MTLVLINKRTRNANVSLNLNCFGVSACCDDAAISTSDDDLCERNAATKFDHSALTFNLFANFCSRNVADAHFKRHASFKRVGPNNRHRANDVNYSGYTPAVKGAVTALSE